uniref:Transmembrane protein n=1 Tax=Heterorhabditis bacteriophora TaxID=37862 RepID=A0A1I7W9W9_HETBA
MLLLNITIFRHVLKFCYSLINDITNSIIFDHNIVNGTLELQSHNHQMNGADSSVGEGVDHTNLARNGKNRLMCTYRQRKINQTSNTSIRIPRLSLIGKKPKDVHISWIMCLSEHTTNNKKASTSLLRVSTSCKKRINNFTTRTINYCFAKFIKIQTCTELTGTNNVWMDSKIVLPWITNDKMLYHPFVQRRINETRNYHFRFCRQPGFFVALQRNSSSVLNHLLTDFPLSQHLSCSYTCICYLYKSLCNSPPYECYFLYSMFLTQLIKHSRISLVIVVSIITQKRIFFGKRVASINTAFVEIQKNTTPIQREYVVIENKTFLQINESLLFIPLVPVTIFSRRMDNFTIFDDHNDALLLFYNINSPLGIILSLLAIYLIVFKSSQEMREYRWYLLYYEVSDLGILCPGQYSNELN